MIEDEAAQTFLEDMCIDLGGRNICVPQKLLNGAQIGATIQ